MRSIALAALWMMAVAAAPCAEPESSPSRPSEPESSIALSGVVGFSEHSNEARPGSYAPVCVDLDTQGKEFTGEIRVRSIAKDERAFAPQLVFSVEAGLRTSKRFRGVFPISAGDESLVAELYVAGKKTTEAHMGVTRVPPNRRLIIALDESPGRLNHLSSVNHPLPSRRRTIVHGQADYLPAHVRGYDGVDAVVVDGGSVLAVSEEQISALRKFVLAGGHVIVCAGSAWQQIDQSFLAGWLPVELKETRTIPSPLPTLANDRPSTAPAPEMLVCRAPLKKNAVNVEEFWKGDKLDFPLGVRARMGGGWMTFLACRLDDNLFRAMPKANLEQFCEAILPDRPRPLFDSVDPLTADTLDNDLKTQSLLPIPTAEAVGAALAGYLLLFLPGLFYFLRWARGEKWAWIAMPISFVAAAAAVFLYCRSEASQQRTFVQLSFVESNAQTHSAWGRTIASLYSPVEDRVDIRSDNGEGLFMPLQTSALESAEPIPFPFATVPEPEIRGLKTPARAARSFQCDFAPPAPAPASAQPSRLVFAREAMRDEKPPFAWTIKSESIDGVAVNDTGFALRDAALIAFGRVQDLGALPAGAAAPVRFDVRRAAPLTSWSRAVSEPEEAQTSSDLNASQALARAGQGVLSRRLSATGRAGLVGWCDWNPAGFIASSKTGFGSVFSRLASTNATWFFVEIPVFVQGGAVHLETSDCDVDAWTSKELHFAWADRQRFHDDLSEWPMEEEYLIRFRPRVGFLRANGSPGWPISSVSGSIIDDWGEGLEMYNFDESRWTGAPERRSERRLMQTALPFVDRTSGEFWLRVRGNPSVVVEKKFDVMMNYILYN